MKRFACIGQKKHKNRQKSNCGNRFRFFSLCPPPSVILPLTDLTPLTFDPWRCGESVLNWLAIYPMTLPLHALIPLFLASFCALGAPGQRESSGPRDLTADQVIARSLEHSRAVQGHLAPYCYSRLTVTEELDEQGHVKERKEKLYDVASTGEIPVLKLVKINGQAVPEARLRQEQAREARVRQQLSAKPEGSRRDMTEIVLTPDLVAKYQFTLEPSELVNGRPSYRVHFEPKPGELPVKELADRVFNHLSGKIWIDQEEFEIAKADLQLESEVKLWGGLLASLRKVSLTLTRTRIEPGVWFNNLATGQFQGRKLLASMRVRTESETTNFRPLPVKNPS